MAKFKNVPDTGDREKCPCTSWIKHYENHGGVAITSCANQACEAKDVQGAHVKKVGGTDTKEYILPLCDDCNDPSNRADMELNPKLGYEFNVEAVVKKDCKPI